ncbi:MAG: radical SAM protein [Deltaproteobacteria bacterium]|nr:radical SAM protein [Deltaproteobacteria bacterium]MBW1920456.1 radical SAM protein [Deltaproteobacteria bacterium]MBW1934584.1 radical SAM protein [Deltaproteobacteria bacterium]RLB35876.1 MAG: radical SAM protein [Deltaproteobacteria bacterium]
MVGRNLKDLPFMLYADSKGRVYEHPFYRMIGFLGESPEIVKEDDLIPMPEYSKLFYLPNCAPMGLDPVTGEIKSIREIEVGGEVTKCYGVAAFLEPGFVRTHLPAVDYSEKGYCLPMWAYTAVGFKDDKYWVAGFRIEYNKAWDPRYFDDKELIPAIQKYQSRHGEGPLLKHLVGCATKNHCFAAKNLFLERWEAPMPVSQACNAECLGCLSFQNEGFCEPSHERISFRPSKKEIVSIAVNHLEKAPAAIISFGQGCEGEPLTEAGLIEESIEEIRKQTPRGTINLNTNGSQPEKVRAIAESGLDSIRISLNSARAGFYRAYYRPRGYDLEDVIESISLSRKLGLYTMLNYLVFPGITDQKAEIKALTDLVKKTGVNFIHLKNLNIDPELYLEKMPRVDSPAVGLKNMLALLKEELPSVEFGYFNKTVR